MRTLLILLLRLLAFAVALAVAVPLASMVVATTPPGRAALARLIGTASDGAVQVTGISGHLPWQPRAARVVLRNPDGTVWLDLRDVTATIDPAALLLNRLSITRLTIGQAVLSALPTASGGGGGGALPVSIRVGALSAPHVTIAAGVFGQKLDLSLSGSGGLSADFVPRARLRVATAALSPAPGVTVQSATVDLTLNRAGAVHLALHVAGGAVGSWQAPGPVTLTVATTLRDPLTAVALDLAGPGLALTGAAGWRAGAGHLDLTGVVANAPAMLAVRGGQAGGGQAGGGWRLDHAALSWRGVGLTASADLPSGAPPPSARLNGTLHLDIADLRDLAPLLGAPLPAGRLSLDAKGRLDALAVALAGQAVLSGQKAQVQAAGVVNVMARLMRLDRLSGTWRDASLHLAAPATLALGAASMLRMPALALGLGKAHGQIAVIGRIAPTLDLTARLSRLPLAALASFGGPAFAGDLTAAAHISGPPGNPAAQVTFAIAGLAPAGPAAGALPPATLRGTASVTRARATLDAHLAAGNSGLSVTGTLPFGPGALALSLRGKLDLALLDPFLAAGGQSIAGTLSTDMTLGGTLAAPRPAGTLRLADGEMLDYASGIHLRAITGAAQADGRHLQITALNATAGKGHLSLTGDVDLTSPADPRIALRLHVANASLPQTDLMTAILGGDLRLDGTPSQGLMLSGALRVARADVRVPKQLPASVATLNVHRPGQTVPAPTALASLPARTTLALSIAAQQIAVRGRGLDVTLGGKVRLSGTLAAPVSSGGFTLRRGRFTIAGHTLQFTSGRIGFDGGSLTDPSLDLHASTQTAALTAQLAMTGTARAPRIALSSTPTLPADEILSELLFQRSTGALGPFEIAELATSLAALSGTAPGIAGKLSDPLAGLRGALGLDRLSVGTAANGKTPEIQAGRYLGHGVYAGVRQDTGGGTQAEMQIDLTRHLRLRATAGTSANSTATAAGSDSTTQRDGAAGSVGVLYRFEY